MKRNEILSILFKACENFDLRQKDFDSYINFKTKHAEIGYEGLYLHVYKYTKNLLSNSVCDIFCDEIKEINVTEKQIRFICEDRFEERYIKVVKR